MVNRRKTRGRRGNLAAAPWGDARVCRRGSEVGIKREEERLMCSAWSLQVEKEITLSAWRGHVMKRSTPPAWLVQKNEKKEYCQILGQEESRLEREARKHFEKLGIAKIK
jgi:hypothetical protein